MNKTNESQSIKICFVGLPLTDQATFERVISFCKARGQHFDITLNPSQSDVLITDDEENNLNTARQLQNTNTLLVVSNDKSCTAGDVQLQRPLLVTRVMRTMESLSSQTSVTNTVSTPASAAKNLAPAITEATPVPAPENKAEQDEPVTHKPSAKSNYKALVIDDSAAIRKQLEIELRVSGITCDFAESGEVALEKIIDTHFDLVFLDIMMPGIDGYETCGKIRKDARYKKTPVIMLSGKTAPLDEVKGVIAGATTYLTKPIKPDHFHRVTGRITKWLDEFRK